MRCAARTRSHRLMAALRPRAGLHPSRIASSSPPPSSRKRVRRGSDNSAVSPLCKRGRPQPASKRASPASRCRAQVVPGSAKNTIGPTSGRCSNSATIASRRHIRLKSWVGPSTSSPVTRAFAGESQAAMRRLQQARSRHRRSAGAGRCRAAAPARDRRPGSAENAASCSISAIDRRQSQSPPGRWLRMDFAGPAQAVAPAFAAVFVGGNDPRRAWIHGECSDARRKSSAWSRRSHRDGASRQAEEFRLDGQSCRTRKSHPRRMFPATRVAIRPCRASCPLLRSIRAPDRRRLPSLAGPVAIRCQRFSDALGRAGRGRLGAPARRRGRCGRGSSRRSSGRCP